MGLSNYWGYNPINYFVPHTPYLGPKGADGLRQAVRALHDAGIEVILDVVYNHTAESWHLGPTLSFKGIDNASFYALQDDRRFYVNHTGTGNMLDMRCRAVRDLTLSSLRYWVEYFGVDGFRFDLAPTLGRMGDGFDPNAPLLAAIKADPVLSQRKLIAEPWDIGPDGYQLGNFPDPWAEWNDEYRDAARSFWRKDAHAHRALAGKLLGSAERFDGRPAWSSVNFLAAHDGFTLHDTVSFNDKHNLANGEKNRDGHGHNLSDNFGVEGSEPTLDAPRRVRKIAMLATLLFGHGTPMLLAGDEFGQSQGGNNNAYCQDNETTWLDWGAADPALQQATRDLIALRKRYPHFRQGAHLHGEALPDRLLRNAVWITPEGREMTDADWHNPDMSCFGLALTLPDQPQLALFFNRGEAVTVRLSGAWTAVLGDRHLETDSVALFEAPSDHLPPWEDSTAFAHAEALGLHRDYYTLSGDRVSMGQATRRALLNAFDRDLTHPPEPSFTTREPGDDVFGIKAFKEMEGSDKGRAWGVTVPLYGLRSDRNWGVGDFEDLARLAENLAPLGVDFIGLNPVHALYPSAPQLFAPYSVSSREWLNVMHVAPDKIPEWAGEAPEIPQGDTVDYAAVYAAKQAAFETAFTAFERLPKTRKRRKDFAAFIKAGGESLRLHALFDTLFEQLPPDQQSYAGWQNFAPDFHDPRSAASQAFAEKHAGRLRYYVWLQWVARDQLRDAQARAKSAGMRIGLYLDFAVGVSAGSSDVWRNRDAFAKGVSLGAPGDAANPDGQAWSLAPLRPNQFEDGGAAEKALRAALRASLTDAGAVRIDHVLGLLRAFWIPDDEGVAGGYVSYPFERLLDILAEESRVSETILFGEDLGTVPPGFRDRMAARGLMGCAVQLIERDHAGALLPPDRARRLSLSAWTNHDFPTVQGFWVDDDLDWRARLGIGADSLEADRAQRARDRMRLAEIAGLDSVPDTLNAEAMAALQGVLAAGPSLAFAVPIEDLLLSKEQPNIPGTVDEAPNWRRRLTVSIEDLASHTSLVTIAKAIARGRRQ